MQLAYPNSHLRNIVSINNLNCKKANSFYITTVIEYINYNNNILLINKKANIRI